MTGPKQSEYQHKNTLNKISTKSPQTIKIKFFAQMSVLHFAHHY